MVMINNNVICSGYAFTNLYFNGNGYFLHEHTELCCQPVTVSAEAVTRF